MLTQVKSKAPPESVDAFHFFFFIFYMAQKPYTRHHSQAVRQRSAKPLFPSSILGGASKKSCTEVQDFFFDFESRCDMFSILFFILSAIFFVLTCSFTVTSLGFCRSYTAQITGYLKETKRQIGGRLGRGRTETTEAIYSYRVEGIEHVVSLRAPYRPCDFQKTVCVIYQKKHPSRSYIKGLTVPIHPIAAGMVFLLSVLFAVSAFLIA